MKPPLSNTPRAPIASPKQDSWQEVVAKLTPGSMATHRLPRPLVPRKFMIRPQSLAEKFAAAGKHLKATDFDVAKQDRRAGNWARLFQNEPAYLYAELISFRADDAGFEFAEALERDPDRALKLVLALSKKVYAWVQRIRLESPMPFSRQLEQLDKDDGLTPLLKQLSDIKPRVLLRIATNHVSVRTLAKQGGPLAEARATRDRLRAMHTVLRNAVSAMKPQAQKAFDARITSGQIDPGLGLLIAELRTAAHVDAAFNALPARHTDLYYREIIGQEPSGASPEMVLLDLGTVQRPRFLPQGTPLEARLPDGTIQHFETDAGVPISPARLSDIRVLSYQTDPNISYNSAFGGITGVRAACSQDRVGLGNATLFNAGTEVPLDLGLDISSPMLSLAEGTRRIEVTLHMSRSSALPGAARAMDDDDKEERAERRKKIAFPDTPPNLRRSVKIDPEFTDPDVRLAAAADPVLISSFYTEKHDIAVEMLTREVSDYAEFNDQFTSLALIYQILMNKVTRPEQLRLLLGRITTLSLIEGAPFPKDHYWDQIFALIEKYRFDIEGPSFQDPRDAAAEAHDQHSMIFAAFSQKKDGSIDYPPEDVFQSLLGDAFDIKISTDDGPLRPDIMQVLPGQRKRSAGGITLSMRYDDSAPALTGPNHAPCLSLRYATDSRLCPVSFFEAYAIETITIRTEVTGLRRLTAFSDNSPVTTDQTFRPFGQRPGEGATFQVGCPEMARKPVTDISINLDWSNIPDPAGGFKTHYAAYGKNIEIPDPELSIDYLSGDGWKPVSDAPQALFQTEPVTGTLLAQWEFSGKVTGHSIPAAGTVVAREYQSRQTIRAGMIRMRMTGTAGGFHVDQYPLALVDAMRPRLLPLGERAIPPAPFVPEISTFSISYTAEATIPLNAPDAARAGETVRQISPFGSVEVFPKRMLRQIRLFPKRLGYGQVSIQLTGADATGRVAIAFSMMQSGHLRLVPPPNPVRWVYLSATGWQDLPETALSSDTTAGLMRSGLVVIDLPEDALNHSTEMPQGGVWIGAVATRPQLEIFPALRGAKINGVWVSRRDDTWKDAGQTRDWAFNPAQPGLTSLREIATPSALRPPEPPETFIARVGERLRHRKRGVTPWDMERMVLQEFPEVWMAKCLPHLSRHTPSPTPGQITLVITRKPPLDEMTDIPAPSLFDVATLKRIRDWLDDYTYEGARIDVVNPTFERLQVRTKLVLSVNRENGAMAQMLRRELARYLSVWTAAPALARFGWSLNVHMLRAHIANLPYVSDLTDFSVLHMAGDDAKSYQLLDTAQSDKDPRGGHYGPVLRPRFPWSLPLSTPDHILTILPELSDEAPVAAGIGSLTIGDMLIVGQRTQP